MMDEHPMFFGAGLLGILTPATRHEESPTVILLNAGLLHRVGPNRLYVDMARRLAILGYSCLRFDTSSVGDSALIEGEMLDIERSRQDVIAAMDALDENTGSSRYVLVGLCTGAFNAFRTALVDDRVAGCILLDGYAFPTLRSRFRHYRSRVLQLGRWIQYAKRRLGISANEIEASTRPDDALIVFENEIVPKERFGRELGALVNKGVSLLMVYTGLGPLAFNYRRQMHDAFRDIDLASVTTIRYYPDADHTFTLPGNRRILLDEIDAWMLDSYPLGDDPSNASTAEATT